MDVETPAWSFWMLRAAAALAGVALVRSGIHGLRGRPLGIANTPSGTVTPATGCAARFWGAFTLFCAFVCLAFAAGGFTE
jgi:hypothetical protein